MYTVFGQELYAQHLVTASDIVAAEPAQADLAAQVADALPFPSPATRQRVACKLLQRLKGAALPGRNCVGFATVLSAATDPATQRELAYYAAACTDPLISGLATDVLYRVLLEDRLPRGITQAGIDAHLVPRLLDVKRSLPLDFLVWYAERMWGFRSERSVRLALRIIVQSGLAVVEPLHDRRRRRLEYSLCPHGITLPAFVWCCYREFGSGMTPVTMDRLEMSHFAQVILIPPTVVAARTRDAEHAGFLAVHHSGSSARVTLVLSSNELVRQLTGKGRVAYT